MSNKVPCTSWITLKSPPLVRTCACLCCTCVYLYICFSSDEEDEEEGDEDEGLGEEGEKPSGEEEETARDTPGADVSGLQCLLKDTYIHT